MAPQDIELVKSTIPVLREHGVALTSYFYQRMLNAEPELKNIFNLDHQSSGMQPKALAGAVLAYAENIDDPSVLAKAIERITNKHVSLNIQADQYGIVGEHLLHSISEVLNVAMDSDLIAAWKAAYLQLADVLIGIEKSKYETLETQQDTWTGWRKFKISAIQDQDNLKLFILEPFDQAPIAQATAGQYISVRVKVPEHDIYQPQTFIFTQSQSDSYVIEVKSSDQLSEFSVHAALLHHYKVGDTVEVSAPQTR